MAPGQFNTPSLVGAWRTAPYLHSGAARDLREVLELTRGWMGHIEELTDDQIDDLVAFMKTL